MSTGSNPFVGATRSTAASGAAVYEGERAVHEYLQFHFGRYIFRYMLYYIHMEIIG